MPENGRLAKSELAPIPGGELAIEAAAAWNAKGGPADAGLLPTGPESTYRTYAGQVKQREYWCNQGHCENAAVPGTSNHGLGVCVDLKEPWMRGWIDEHGHFYGWAKTEAFQEWWHVNYDGSKHFPTFDVLSKGDKGKRVKRYTRRLAYIHRPHGKAYLRRAVNRYGRRVVAGVEAFQEDHNLHVDGEIGAATAGRIDAVFRRQYQERHHRHRRPEHAELSAATIARAEHQARPKAPTWKLLYAARFVAKWEGFLAHAYLDTIAVPAVWTIGYGHTGPDVHPGDHVTKAQALRLLTKDLRTASAAVKRSIKVKLSFRQRIALISLAFNCGPGAVEGSTLQAKLNAGDYHGAANEFLKWCHAGGVVVQGLLNRRKQERWIFLHDKRR